MYSCAHVCMYSCTDVLMYSCTNVLMYWCTYVLMYSCTNILMYSCTHVLMYSCHMYVLIVWSEVSNSNHVKSWIHWKLPVSFQWKWRASCCQDPSLGETYICLWVKVQAESFAWNLKLLRLFPTHEYIIFLSPCHWCGSGLVLGPILLMLIGLVL